MKKRILSLLLCVAMLLTLLPQTVLFASAATSGTCGTNLRWSYNSSTYTLTITGSGAMTRWSSYSSVPWYSYRSSIQSVSLPDGLTSIGSRAFYGCSGLTSITIPSGVTSIGSRAFYGCSGLTSITIPDSVTSIGEYAFYGCTGLTSVTIGNGVTSIGDDAFYGCTGLTSITIPDSVTSIGNGAFYDCTGLTEVHISDIASWCGISFDGYRANPLCDAKNLYLNNILITDLVIPDSVTAISDYAFRDCTGLTSVTIGHGVTKIGEYAFYCCTGLTSVTIGNGVTKIGEEAFHHCTGLTSITVAEGNTVYDSRNNCNAIIKTGINTLIIGCKNTMIPDSVTSIGDSAFRGCTGLTSITIPDSVTSIGEYAFYGCTGLTDIAILNPNCSIYNDSETLAGKAKTTVYGYSGSTAESYAKKYGYTFKTLDEYPYEFPSDSDDQNIPTDIFPEISPNENTVKQQLGTLSLGPFEAQGAMVSVLGHDIPLIDLSASVKLGITDLKIVSSEEDETVRVILGYDENSSANIVGSNNSSTYWSESYQEVKSLYKDLTGKAVDSTRLWNRFSSLRGKLKSIDADLVVKVKCELAGYAEFKKEGSSLVFSEGGIMASFSASSSLRSYYGPAYVTLGIGVGADGSLTLVRTDKKVTPQISVSPSLEATIGAGIGTRKSYAEITAYGKLIATIASDSKTPFTLKGDVGAKWAGYLFGKEIFSGSKSFASAQLFPRKSTKVLISDGIDVSTAEAYTELVNAATPISRSYLTKSTRRAVHAGEQFLKDDLYPLNQPVLTAFNDGSMLLVWIDDLGEKSVDNLGSILYSVYNGETWSDPAAIYEDGTFADMPAVYSDGTQAYIVWQKADRVFSNESSTEKLCCFDLYESTYDAGTGTFTAPVCLAPETNSSFELCHVVCANENGYSVAWIENTDNNIYQETGTNSLHIADYSAAGILLSSRTVVSTENLITDFSFAENGELIYILCGDNTPVLHFSDSSRIVSAIDDFDVANGILYYLQDNGLHAECGITEKTYPQFAGLDNMTICSNGSETALLTMRINPDLTKSLYISRLDSVTGEWSPLENYSQTDCYIRNYSAVMTNDGDVRVAFNYISENALTASEKSTLTVEGTEGYVDLEMLYVDYNDKDLHQSTIEMNCCVQNNSSTNVSIVKLTVCDENNEEIICKQIPVNLPAFSSTVCSVALENPQTYLSETLTVTVSLPETEDINPNNNSTTTSVECIHLMEDTYTVDIAPTCTQLGRGHAVCVYCGETVEEVDLPSSGHLYLDGRCTACGAPERPVIYSAYLRLNQNINLAFTAVLPDDYENPYIVFAYHDTETKVDTYTVNSDGQYCFELADINPQCMGDNISATLYATYDGTEYTDTVANYSVRDYCVNQLAKTDDATLKTLLSDILVYGAAAQVYMDYKTDALVTDGLDLTPSTFNAISGKTVSFTGEQDESTYWTGAALVLSNDLAARFAFVTDSTEGLTVEVGINGRTKTFTAEDFASADGKENTYSVTFYGIMATEFDDTVTAAFRRDGKQIGAAVNYSVNTYICSTQNVDNTALQALVRALYNYGASAKAYAAK